jgi:cephalosporin hydroxylase
MTLSEVWQDICQNPVPLEDLPPSRWKHPWSTHPAGARRLYNTVRWKKPATIVETGTFEGLGTYALAKAAQTNGGKARIFTIDYDGDPDVSIPAEDWRELRGFREENLERARKDFPDVEITFVDGDSRLVLPPLLKNEVKSWDLFFQDSMHFMSGILAEWEIAKPYAAENAVVIFDDVCLDWKKLPSHLLGKKDFCLHFVLTESFGGDWTYRTTGEGRGQFFAQKRG